MNALFRSTVGVLLTLACAAPALAQPKDGPKDKPLPEPLPMGIPYYYQPGNNYWYAPAAPGYPPFSVRSYTPYGTYYTVYAAYRPVIELRPSGPVCVTVPAAPVVVGPTWNLLPVSCCSAPAYPFGSSGPVFGRYSWDYTGFSTSFGWYGDTMPHYPYSFQYPTLSGRVWMGFGW